MGTKGQHIVKYGKSLRDTHPTLTLFLSPQIWHMSGLGERRYTGLLSTASHNPISLDQDVGSNVRRRQKKKERKIAHEARYGNACLLVLCNSYTRAVWAGVLQHVKCRHQVFCSRDWCETRDMTEASMRMPFVGSSSPSSEHDEDSDCREAL